MNSEDPYHDNKVFPISVFSIVAFQLLPIKVLDVNQNLKVVDYGKSDWN